MSEQSQEGVLKSSGGAPDFARETGAPPIVKEHEGAHSPNTLDPAKGAGRQRGDGAKE